MDPASSTIPNARGGSQERAYRHIKTRILDQRFSVGCRLRAQDIAQSMSLSRTPVREALGRLEQEGLVRRDSGWGFVVRGMSLREIVDLFEVREALETRALATAMPNMDPKLLHKLGSLLDTSQAALDAGRPAESLRIARRFHTTIAQASGNILLMRMLSDLNERIHSVGLSIAERFPERPSAVLKENRSLLAAIERGDSSGALKRLRLHIHRSRELLLKR
jgi:DNA-binding GntR family transcriptional regulator